MKDNTYSGTLEVFEQRRFQVPAVRLTERVLMRKP